MTSLSRTPFPACHSLLRGSALADVLARDYDLARPVHCSLLHSGDNDTYLVSDKASRYVFRVYRHGKRSRRQIESEVNLLIDLDRAGLSVPVPISAYNTSTVQRLSAVEGERFGVLFRYVEGTLPGFSINDVTGTRYGATVAHVHDVCDLQGAIYHRPRLDEHTLLDQPQRLLAPLLSHRPSDTRRLEIAISTLKERVGALPRSAPSFGLCHGDLHKRNCLMDDQGRLTVLDWDCAAYGWRAYDLAVLRWSMGIAVGPAGLDQAEAVFTAYLDGYRRYRALSPLEIATIPALVAVRQVWNMGVVAGHIVEGHWGHDALDRDTLDDMLCALWNWMGRHSLERLD